MRNVYLAVLGFLILAALPMPAVAAEPETATDGSAAEQKIMAAMERPAAFAFNATILESVVEHIESAYQIPVEVDAMAIAELHIPEKLRLSLTIEGVKLRTALHFLLTPYDLTWIICNDSLLITTKDLWLDGNRLTLHVYGVGDLLADQPDQQACDAWADQLSNLLHRSDWVEEGGNGTIRVLPTGVLVISQISSIQADVQTLLSALRLAIANQQLTETERRYAPVHQGDAAVSAAWRKRLTTARDFNLGDTPLDVLAAYLSDLFEAPVLVDNEALQELGESENAPISYVRNGVRTAAALTHMLGPGRSWYIKDEVLVITSREEAEWATEIRIYPVGDLISLDDDGLTPDVLIETLETMIQPRDWRPHGGAGVAEFFARGNLLAISQTFQNHERIEKLLNDLRSHRTLFEDIAPAEPPTRR